MPLASSEKSTSYQRQKRRQKLPSKYPKMCGKKINNKKRLTQKLIFGLLEKYTYQVGKL